MIGARFHNVLIAVLLSLLLAACGEETTPEPLHFPLNKGLSWTYAVDVTTPTERRQEDLTIINGGAVSFKGKASARRSTGFGTDYILQHDSTGVFRVAKRTLTQAEPESDKAPRYVLKRPYKVGTAWASWTRLYMMMFRPPHGRFNNSLFYEKPFLMTYQIAALKETVSVPAGTFKDCIKVVGTADLSLYLDGKQGFVSVPITTEEWYAPGVGLVKMTREEKLEADTMEGGSYTMELVSLDD